MATITGLTADRMQQIIDKTIVGANIVGGHLILTLTDGSTIDAGPAQGAPGAPGTGVGKGNAFPGAPTEGDLFIRTDQSGDPMYKYVAGTWVSAGGGLNKVTAFPASPQDGDVIVRTDLNGSPLYAYSTENGWEPQPRMGAVTVPNVDASNAAAQAIPNDVDTVVAFTAESSDTDNMHDLVTNNTRLVCKTPGKYLLWAYLNWAANASGNFRAMGFRINSPGFNQWDQWDRPNGRSGFPSESAHARIVTLKAGDYIELFVRQDSGGTLNLNTGEMGLTWLGGNGQTVDERGVPAVKATSSVQQTIPTNVYTALSLWNQESYDTEGIHDLVTNPGRLSVKTSGLYRVSASVYFGFAANVRLRLMKNGSVLFGDSPNFVVPGGASPGGFVTVIAEGLLAPGDYLEVQLWHDNASSQAAGFTFLDERMYFAAALLGTGKTVTPYAKAFASANQGPVVAGGNSYLSFDSEVSDNDAIHDTVTNNSRLTCRTAGVYIVEGDIQHTVAGPLTWSVYKNGRVDANVVATTVVPNGVGGSKILALLELSVGDYLELRVFNGSGANVTITGGSGGGNPDSAYSTFAMVKVGSPGSPAASLPTPQADVYTVATLPAANTFPNGRIVGVSDGAAGQQARMAMGGAWINLG